MLGRHSTPDLIEILIRIEEFRKNTSSSLSSLLALSALVEIESVMVVSKKGDLVLCIQFFKASSSHGTVDLELVAHDRKGNHVHLWHISLNSVPLLWLKVHCIVKLILDLNLGPALLLSFSSFFV